MELVIKRGKYLSKEYLDKWNKTRLKDFDENKPLFFKNKKKFENDIFFTLYNSKKEVLSSGRLRPIKLKFMKKDYEILGGADLISEIKGKGYGRKVKKAQIKYAKKKKKTMIGFCTKHNTPFYKKCGLIIKGGIIKRFIYPKEKEEYYDTHVTFLNGKDNLTNKILKNPKEKIILPIPHW